MSDSTGNIEDYFNGNLSATEREALEKRCISDPLFAEEVAFYVSMRDGLKHQLYEQKREEFARLHARLSVQQKPQQTIVTRLLPYAAAACLLLVLGWALFFRGSSAQGLADRYIRDNLQTLGSTMGGATDSLQTGIAAYNNKQYSEAGQIFEALTRNPAGDAEAVKDLGLVYLATEQYDRALVQFDALAQQTGLYANPGLFYKALTLLKRSAGDDKKRAKQMLEEVRQKNLPGAKEAEAWIPKL